MFHEARSLEESVPDWLKGWKGNGIIARIQNQEIASLVRQTGLPVVDVLGLVPKARIPLVHVDNREIARMAAEHLRERGFRHFGYYGLLQENWSLERRDFFRKWLGESGHDLAIYEQPRHARSHASWEERENRLAQWILKLPKPAGVMVCSDQRGLDLLEACRRARVAVPDAVAVVGVDNDEALCDIAHPPLSSVLPAHHQVGYEAAALLDKLMRGGRPPRNPVLIRPTGVKTRQSTDVLAVQDRNISRAVQVIREEACHGLSVDRVAKAAGISRSVLQRRFQTILGKTVHQEMIDIRLKRASALLAETDLPLIEVAELAGFNHQEYLGAVLRTHFGKTPSQFRREAREKKNPQDADW